MKNTKNGDISGVMAPLGCAEQEKGTEKKKQLSYTNTTAFFPLLLIMIPPLIVLYLLYASVYLNGSLSAMLELWASQGFVSTTVKIALPYLLGSWTAWKIVASYAIFELILMRVLPGRYKEGPPSPAGNVPVYKANGVQAYFFTLATFCILTYFGFINPSLVYNHYGEIIGALNLTAVISCCFLYLKGRYYPSSTDASHSGNLIFDYYWGTELYPRILGMYLYVYFSFLCMHMCSGRVTLVFV